MVMEARSKAEFQESGVVVVTSGDRIIDFEEKPDNPKSKLVSLPLYRLSAETIPFLKKYLMEGNNSNCIGCFFSWSYRRRPLVSNNSAPALPEPSASISPRIYSGVSFSSHSREGRNLSSCDKHKLSLIVTGKCLQASCYRASADQAYRPCRVCSDHIPDNTHLPRYSRSLTSDPQRTQHQTDSHNH